MTTTEAQLGAVLEDLTPKAFSAFCDDIAGMFDCSMQTLEQKILHGPISQLQNDFKRVASINTVEINGVLDGQFGIWFDQAALFILSGIVVMLPEKRIRENVKSGGIKEAQSLNDAIKELGNLMTGSWDRIFRDGLNNHKHLKQGSVFIGQPWQNPNQSLGLDPKTESLIVTAKIKVGDFEPVLCAAVYPTSLLEPKPQPQPKPEASATQTPNPPEPPAEEFAPSVPAPVAKIETIVHPPQPSPVSKAIEQLVQLASDKSDPSSNPESRTFGPFNLNNPVQTICHSNPVWIDPNDSIQQAIQLMQLHNTNYLLAGKDGQLDGILSRSDLAAAISPYTKSVFANYRRPLDDASFQLRCKWFISRPVRAISPETPIGTAIDIMCRYAVRSLVILDSQQKVSGLITTFDILRKLICTDESALAGTISQAPPFVVESNMKPKPFAVG